MRIRKRKVPLPLSLLSPIPLSDPHLFSQSPVHLHHHHHNHHHQPPPSDYFSLTSAPSDLRPLINNTNPTASGVKQDPEEEDKDEQRSCLEFQGGGGREKIAQKSNNDNHDGASKEEVELEVAVNNNGPVGVSLPNEGLGRWSGGERVIPLKKRRPSESSFEKDVYDNCKEQTVVATNSEHENNSKKGSGGGGSTKQKRGTTIMEGSRCSRVNGRGWRCCQPTLVGYSLCEHHLGKGRLRSMTSVRGRPSSKKQHHHMVKDNYRDHQEKQQATSKRANYKLGVVKARSLSSLLGQTASTTTTITTTTTTGTTTTTTTNAGHDHVVALSTN